ncbi:DNA methylase N-4/N-6 [Streptococcus sp. GMD4S]|uniref:DNA-methyltransferase n=1 Tax=unclassified Streptococcus TaxID=2608887 RepID=UPI000280D938|nr:MULTISPECIES: site-specific DNA-methyltransferase [unclassified Streptococcus]EKA02757.1 DNA methylase N-4/N-6 [Streptococcus sp. GMD4S]EKA06674.1 DNA methylase N-4/N-6 [Streptococcus sp. GMD6S]EKA10290.1 DNA methylase N-4/N-6 [Streptococcus sp. GMD2S]EKA17242.1 DNA methylase N-4/N-6 [Streptococcus sp. GMD1S]
MSKVSYRTQLGECINGDSLQELQDLGDNSVNLVVTSPPFALQRKKEYGNESQEKYVEWLAQFAKVVFDKLRDDGSFVIDIGGAYEKGEPSYSLYQFRALIKFCDEIGFKLAQPFYWHNPSALPSPIEWVNKRKLRAKTSVNTVWWLCKDPRKCKANVSKVLSPYSDRMKKLISRPEEYIKGATATRPSGHVHNKESWSRDNGGAIPSNLLQIPNSESNSKYLRYCKKYGIKGHPARFPAGLPEFFINFLTDEGDLVIDIFGGSNTTGMVAENNNRRWKAFELSKEYAAASIFRFLDEDNENAEKYYQQMIDGKTVEL